VSSTLRGEHLYEVEPLPVPAGEETTPAVELFLDRARAARPDFRPTGDDLTAIAELTRELDGLPLAIELASAWVRVMSPRAILERLGERPLELLRTGSRDMPERQQTLRETMAWSYSLLSTDAQTLFARLSVFVGSVDLEAIEQVANPDGGLPTLDLLGSLVENSLVRPAKPSPSSACSRRSASTRPSSSRRAAQPRRLGAATKPITWSSPSEAASRAATSMRPIGSSASTISRPSSSVPCVAAMPPREYEWGERSLGSGICASYEPLMAEARHVDFDAAMEELASEAPAG
jgi:hypothetical protein